MRRKREHLDYLALTAVFLLAAVCLLRVSLSSNQAALSAPLPLTPFSEYSYDGGETWAPLTDDTELSALRGSVFLRGHVDSEISEGAYINYYRNHIGVSLYLNGKLLTMDAVAENVFLGIERMRSMCGREWSGVYLPGITPEDTVEFHLYNPHTYGNKTAYRDFLNTLCIGPNPATSELLQKNLASYGLPSRIIGGLLTILTLILLGASISAAAVRIPIWGTLLKIGLLLLFAGGFILLDTIDMCFWCELLVFGTYARQLCMMLAVLCLGYCICGMLTGNVQRIAEAAVSISALLDAALIILSFTGTRVIYDTLLFWIASQWLLNPLLAVCCVCQLRAKGKKGAFAPISGFVFCAAILLDIGGVGGSILSYGVWSKGVLCLLCVVYIITAVKRIVRDYQAGFRVRTLEQELQESRISIMLSQLQPHFLFNVLNSIYYLCGTNPDDARVVVNKFSSYLRNNLESINQKTMIPFSEELDHIQTYLELEKIRFDEELTVVYDIQTDDFFLPILTVQPLVENAVKHGVTKKRGGGIVTLATREETDGFVVTVTDTGIGFDPAHYLDDGKTHIGIQNVRQRLEHMAGGTLEITSAPGCGTTAVIRLPKKKEIEE